MPQKSVMRRLMLTAKMGLHPACNAERKMLASRQATRRSTALLDLGTDHAAWAIASYTAMDFRLDDMGRRLNGFRLLDAPGHLLRRNHQRSSEIFARHLGCDVTPQQIALLVALSDNPGSSQRELVEATGIDKSTLKEILSRMISRELVRRDRDPDDRRAWTMRTTPGGEALLEEYIDAVAAAQREMVAPLSESDRAIFVRCLRILLGLDYQDG